MSSIPLVALNAKAPEQPDTLQKYGQLLQLKNAMQQSKLQQQEAPLRLQALQQQTQSGQVGLQQAQQAQKDQQAVTAALQQYDGKDINALAPLVLKNGGSAQAVFGLKKQIQDQQKAAADLFKTQADAGKATIETTKQKNDMIVGALQSLHSIPDDQLAQSATQTITGLAQKGLLDPQSAQQAMQVVQSGDPNAIRQGVDQFSKTLMTHTQILDQAHKEAQEANDKALRAQQADNAKETARHNAVEESLGKNRLSAEYARLQFDKQRQGVQDQNAIEQQAQQIANGDVKPLSQARNNPYSRAVMARAYEINPGLSDQLYATKQDFLSSKGKANAQVQSLNKLSAHLQELQSASEKAGFSPVGYTAAGKDLRLAEQLFSKEDVKFLSGSGIGTEGELNALIEKTHSPIQSVRDSAIDTLSKFTADAARQIGDQYERGTKQKFDPNQHFTPTTVQMMDKHGGTSARPAQPKDGETKTNSHGDKIVFKDGQWQLQ
jgi:hypothetical protein